MSCVLPSENVPVALNLREVPRAIRGFGGFTLIETRCAVETVSPVDPLTAAKAALIVLLPVATLVSKPWLSMVAAAGFEDVQTEEALMSCVLVSLNVPIAVNCFAVPTAMLEFAGVTAIEIKVAPLIVSDAVPLAVNCSVVLNAMDGAAGVTEIEVRCAATTVNVVVSVSEPTVAVIVVDPAPIVAAIPELSMVATAVDEEFQLTPLTRSALEPSL